MFSTNFDRKVGTTPVELVINLNIKSLHDLIIAKFIVLSSGVRSYDQGICDSIVVPECILENYKYDVYLLNVLHRLP